MHVASQDPAFSDTATPVLESSAQETNDLSFLQTVARRLAALLFSALFVSIPWYDWRPRKFKDVHAYLSRMEFLRTGADFDTENLGRIEYVFTEPLWSHILAVLDGLFDEPMDALLVVSFVVMLAFSNFLFTRANPWLGSILLLNPLVIDLLIAQVRSALASALCLIATSLRRRVLVVPLVLAATLIHSLTFVFIGTYLVAKFLERRQRNLDYFTCGASALLCGIAISITIGLGHTVFLSAVQDRRALIEHTTGDTVAYCIYWMLLAVAIAFNRRSDSPIAPWNDFYVITMLSIPFCMTFFTVPSARLIPLAFPLILASVFARHSTMRTYLLASLCAYQFLQFIYWLS